MGIPNLKDPLFLSAVPVRYMVKLQRERLARI